MDISTGKCSIDLAKIEKAIMNRHKGKGKLWQDFLQEWDELLLEMYLY
jgi:hypothetical protein